MERLQKIISAAGICSRRKAEELILAGRVKVNDEIIITLGSKVSDTDIIKIDDTVIGKEPLKYLLLNKPSGYITTTKDQFNRPTVLDLINYPYRVYPVGRLDYDTTGALLLTNDGEFANTILHPSNNINKTYFATLSKDINDSDLAQLANGVFVDGVKTAPAEAKKVNIKQVELTIHEGRNHQVKNMFAALGYKVISLKRIKIGNIDLKNLKLGQYRTLTNKEIVALKQLAKNS